MTESEQLLRRIAGLEAQLADAEASSGDLRQQVSDSEAALRAAYEVLGEIGDPLFAATFEEARTPEIARLRRQVRRLRKRNRRLAAELAQVRGSRAVRWSDALRRVGRSGRLRGGNRTG